jgi:poly-gamma-glutamate capsule biosynthesis protein CapA/YwtB (metallophosphatase superfamily)
MWCLFQSFGAAVLEFQMYKARNWIPNRPAVLLDLSNGVLIAFAVAMAYVVGIYSLLGKKARWSAVTSIVIASIITIYFTGIYAFINLGYISDVKKPVKEEIAHFRKPPESDVTIIAGGDVSFDLRFEKPYVVREKSPLGNLPITLTWFTNRPTMPFPRLNLPSFLGESNVVDGPLPSEAEPIILPPLDTEELKALPFSHVHDLLEHADIAFVNLESPLAEPRRFEAYQTTSEPYFVDSLREGGIDVVNLANNHCFDAEESGLLQTISVLEREGIKYTGVGKDFDSACAGVITEVKGLKIAWLGYTHKVGRVGINYAAARRDRVGCLPLDPALIYQNISEARKRADLVIVTPHWGLAGSHHIPENIEWLGRWMIDAGADIVLGQGPHLYQAIAIYKERPIVYSMGTFVFGVWYKIWKDNILVRLRVKDGIPVRLEILPISGIRNDLFEPHFLKDQKARKVLQHLVRLSKPYGTRISIEGDIGIIDIGNNKQ